MYIDWSLSFLLIRDESSFVERRRRVGDKRFQTFISVMGIVLVISGCRYFSVWHTVLVRRPMKCAVTVFAVLVLWRMWFDWVGDHGCLYTHTHHRPAGPMHAINCHRFVIIIAAKLSSASLFQLRRRLLHLNLGANCPRCMQATSRLRWYLVHLPAQYIYLSVWVIY